MPRRVMSVNRWPCEDLSEPEVTFYTALSPS